MDNTNKQTKINSDLIKNLQKFFDSDLEEQIALNNQTKMPMFGQIGSDSSEKEIVVNIKTYIYEKNEKGETVAPYEIIENNFYIPIGKDQDSIEALKLFTDRMNSCLSQSSQGVSPNE